MAHAHVHPGKILAQTLNAHVYHGRSSNVPPLHTHTDNNSKVAAAALQGVDKLVASYGSALESSLGLLVPVANR